MLYLNGLTAVCEVLLGIGWVQYRVKRLLKPMKFQHEEGGRQRPQHLLQDKPL